jgi:hypothetical protein
MCALEKRSAPRHQNIESDFAPGFPQQGRLARFASAQGENGLHNLRETGSLLI